MYRSNLFVNIRDCSYGWKCTKNLVCDFLNFLENGVTENGEAAVKDVPKSEKTVVGILNKV
jgi:hypothetical protein